MIAFGDVPICAFRLGPLCQAQGAQREDSVRGCAQEERLDDDERSCII